MGAGESALYLERQFHQPETVNDHEEPLAPLDPLQRYTVKETLAYLRTSRQSFYSKILNKGKIAVIKEGARTFIPGSEIVRLSRVETQAAA
jgi:Helix-turn-helix domain